MQYIRFQATVIGPSHIEDQLPNQDAVGVLNNAYGQLITVCDGLGSRRYSNVGSQAAVNLIKDRFRLPQYSIENECIKNIHDSWLQKFGEGSQDYDTTCLWAHVAPDGLGKAAQLGDGLIMFRSNGVFKVLSTSCQAFSNLTLSLAKSDFNDWVHTQFELTRIGDGVLVMTDGISDDLLSDQFENFFNFIYLKSKNRSSRAMKKWLASELRNWSTPKHGDDKSIAGIFKLRSI